MVKADLTIWREVNPVSALTVFWDGKIDKKEILIGTIDYTRKRPDNFCSWKWTELSL